VLLHRIRSLAGEFTRMVAASQACQEPGRYVVGTGVGDL